jgi:hypothetical protein
MLSISGLIIIVAVALFIWFWQSSLRAKELAVAACKNICQQRNLQFLDGTAHLIQIRLRRNNNGNVRILRRYGFDYYDGQARLSSTISILDSQVINIGIPDLLLPTENTNNVLPFPKDKTRH